MCQHRKESIIWLSQDWKWDGRVLLFGQISAPLWLYPHILILLLLVLCLCWKITAFSWVIHISRVLPLSTQAQQLDTVTAIHWAHTESEHTHIHCMHTHSMFTVSHTHTLGDCLWKARTFPPQLFWSDIIPILMKNLSAIPLSSCLSASLAHFHSRNHTYSFCICTFLLFPRQQWQRILHRRTQPMALAVVWVVGILGSVELAACVCACFGFMYVCGWTYGGHCMCT